MVKIIVSVSVCSFTLTVMANNTHTVRADNTRYRPVTTVIIRVTVCNVTLFTVRVPFEHRGWSFRTRRTFCTVFKKKDISMFLQTA